MNNYTWIPAGGIHLEPEAEAAVKATRNALVVAGPGTGKTELLAQRADYLFKKIQYPHSYNILAISFKRDAASNLTRRVADRSGAETRNRFYSYTYDAFAKQLLDQFRDSLPEQWRPTSNYKVEDNQQLSANYGELFGKPDQKPNIIHQTFDMLPVPSEMLSEGEARIWHRMLGHTETSEACLTFRMISKLVLLMLNKNPEIVSMMRLSFPFILLDEFQDTTDIQFQLVEKCFLSSKCTLTAVGDSKQRIMLWAGARPTVFEDFRREFQADEYKLQMNHRSAPKLLKLQAKMYQSLGEDTPKIVTSDASQKGDGEVQLFESKDERQEAEMIGNDILRKIQQGIQPEDIAVLVKMKPEQYVAHLLNWLSLHGIRARIENKFQDLLNEPITILVLSTFAAALGTLPAKEWPEFRRQFFLLRSVDTTDNDIELTGKGNRFNIETRELDNYLVSLRGRISDMEKRYVANIRDLLNDVVRFYGVEELRSSIPQYSQGEYLSQTLNSLNESLEDSYRRSSSFACAIDDLKGKDTVSIMTIHKSKGLEYESVYFLGLEDSAFWNFKKQPEEDRSAFFVAISRAKRSLTFSFCERRKTKFGIKQQQHGNINEFFELLLNDDITHVIDAR